MSVTHTRLAESCRSMASDVDAGTAPKFGVGRAFERDGSPVCVLGHVCHRAGYRVDDVPPNGAANVLRAVLDRTPSWLVSSRALRLIELNDGAVDAELRATSLSVPLRLLADALDAMGARP